MLRQLEAGIDVPSDGEFGKSISWSQYALERLSGFERRTARPGEHGFNRGADRALCGLLPRARRRRWPAGGGGASAGIAVCVGPDLVHRSGGTATRHRQFQVSVGAGGRGAGLPARRFAHERDPGPQERVLQVRRGAALRDRRCDARGIPGDRRRRPPAPARRRASGGDLRPHGPAGELRRLPQLGGDERGGDQPLAAGNPGRTRALPRVLGKLAGSARHRRAAEGHRRPGAEGQGRHLCHRRRQSPPRARMAGLGKREAARRGRCSPPG